MSRWMTRSWGVVVDQVGAADAGGALLGFCYSSYQINCYSTHDYCANQNNQLELE